ncbi:MAG: resolvase [Clostridiales bacterium]|nr:resolvase [Clostridiales bacterium]
MNMCTALEELKNEGREEGREEGKKEGREDGKELGRTEVLVQLVKEGLISISEAAKKLNMSEVGFESLL